MSSRPTTIRLLAALAFLGACGFADGMLRVYRAYDSFGRAFITGLHDHGFAAVRDDIQPATLRLSHDPSAALELHQRLLPAAPIDSIVPSSGGEVDDGWWSGVAHLSYHVYGGSEMAEVELWIQRSGRDYRIETLRTSNPSAAARTDSAALWPDRRVVLDAAASAALLDGCWDAASRARVTGIWTPSEAQVAMADSVLREGLAGPGARRTLKSQALARYYRQLTGLRLDGDSVVYLNGFDHAFNYATGDAETDTSAWRRQGVCVQGGGAYYFNAAVNPSTRRLEWLRFNPGM